MGILLEQRRLLPAVLDRAECLTADHFRLSAFDARRLPYDLVTGPEAVREDVLARVVRVERTAAAPPPATRGFYRIELQEPSIVRRLQAEPAVELDDLLLYVLTHELVHVVRFCTYQQCYGASSHEREERNVAATTDAILRPLGRRGLLALLGSNVD